jgi:spore maturation protein CgeB
MRLLIVDTCYPAFLRAHYQRQPGLERESYAVQWRRLMKTHFGTADAYSHNLAELGHEAHEVVANCRPLQDAWLREKGVRLPTHVRHLPWRLQAPHAVLAQVAVWKPDVVYVQNVAYLGRRALAALRRSGAFIAGQIATEAPTASTLGSFDLLLTSFPHYVDRFRSLGLPAEYFRIGFDPRVLDRVADAPQRVYDVVFVGGLGRKQHTRSNPLLAEAAAAIPIDFWGYGVEAWSAESPVRRRFQGEAWGVDMFRVLRAARISLNRHGQVSERYANNMRLYEATGVGSFLLTDAKTNLSELFDVGKELVTYASAEELVSKAKYYLEHEEERERIAVAGQARTLRDHTYAVRMRELSEILTRATRSGGGR